MRVLAVNGSARMGRGLTELVLGSFLDGMREAGADAERLCAQRIRLKPCACGEMHCWTTTPGACCIRDGMDDVVPKLKAVDTLVLATPVTIPLPERMQTFINRLCPLVEPRLTFVGRRTRGRLRDAAGPTEGGRAVLEAASHAGRELAETGRMEPATLSDVRRPLVAEEELRRFYNAWI